MEIVACHVDPLQLRLQLRSLAPYRIERLRILTPDGDDGWARDEVAWASPVCDVVVEPCWYGEDLEDLPWALRTYLTCDEPLGYKVLLPLLVRAPFLFMDGDVILTGDPVRHLACRYPWASRSGLDDWTKRGTMKAGNARLSQLAIEVHEEFGYRPPVSRRRTDAAVWYVPRPVDRDEYFDWLVRFFELPQVQADAYTGGNRRRTLDQKFLSVWMATHGAAFTGGHEPPHLLADCYRAVASWKSEMNRRSLGKATFLHYCCSGQKSHAIAKYSGLLP